MSVLCLSIVALQAAEGRQQALVPHFRRSMPDMEVVLEGRRVSPERAFALGLDMKPGSVQLAAGLELDLDEMEKVLDTVNPFSVGRTLQNEKARYNFAQKHAAALFGPVKRAQKIDRAKLQQAESDIPRIVEEELTRVDAEFTESCKAPVIGLAVAGGVHAAMQGASCVPGVSATNKLWKKVKGWAPGMPSVNTAWVPGMAGLAAYWCARTPDALRASPIDQFAKIDGAHSAAKEYIKGQLDGACAIAQDAEQHGPIVDMCNVDLVADQMGETDVGVRARNACKLAQGAVEEAAETTFKQTVDNLEAEFGGYKQEEAEVIDKHKQAWAQARPFWSIGLPHVVPAATGVGVWRCDGDEHPWLKKALIGVTAASTLGTTYNMFKKLKRRKVCSSRMNECDFKKSETRKDNAFAAEDATKETQRRIQEFKTFVDAVKAQRRAEWQAAQAALIAEEKLRLSQQGRGEHHAATSGGDATVHVPAESQQGSSKKGGWFSRWFNKKSQ